MFWVIVVAASAVVSVAAGRMMYARMSSRPALERWIAAALPGVFIVSAVKIASAVRVAPCWVWNDLRLARSISLLHGYRLYYGQLDNGPVIGTMHFPISHMVYTVAGLFSDPESAIKAALALASALVVGPAAWLCFARRAEACRDLLLSAACFGVLLFAIINTRVYYAVFAIHADAVALAFMTFAAGLLYLRSSPSNGALLLSALFAVLTAFSKQTFALVPVALAVFVLLAEGARKFTRYLAYLTGFTVLAGGALIAAFGPLPSILFNVFVITTDRPAKHLAPIAAQGYAILRADVLPALCCLLFFIIYQTASGGAWRPLLRANRWAVFVAAAFGVLPTTIVAWFTVGGSRNHLGVLIYVVFIAAVLAIRDVLEQGQLNQNLHVASWCMLAGLLIINADRIPWNLGWTTNSAACATRLVWNYERKHPGKAYFPKTPLAPLMAEGKLFHSDYPVLEREISGYPLTPAQLRAHIPERELIAMPADEPLRSEGMQRQLAGYEQASDPELPGWLVYKRAHPAAAYEPHEKRPAPTTP